jgi:hypothetical protein
MTTLNDLNGYLDDEAYTIRVGELRALLSASIADTAGALSAEQEREQFEADYATVWNAALKNNGWNGDHVAGDVKDLREGDTYGEGRDYLNARWEGWQARAALNAPASQERADADTAWQVTIDSRDLFDKLRACWRDGQSYGASSEQASWSMATDYAVKAIEFLKIATPASSVADAPRRFTGEQIAALRVAADALVERYAEPIRAILRDAEVADAAGAKPVAWVRYRSDGGFEGPIMDTDERMCDTRRKSGAWTPLYAAPNSSGNGARSVAEWGTPAYWQKKLANQSREAPAGLTEREQFIWNLGHSAAQDDALDAARYRWLRNEHFPTADNPPLAQVVWKFGSNRRGSEWANLIDGNDLDAAIDRARQSGEEGK